MLPFPETKKKIPTLQISSRITKSVVTASLVKHLRIPRWKALTILEQVIATAVTDPHWTYMKPNLCKKSFPGLLHPTPHVYFHSQLTWQLLTALFSLGLYSIWFGRWANTCYIFFSQNPKLITLTSSFSVYTSTTVLLKDVCDWSHRIRRPSYQRQADTIRIFFNCPISCRIPFKGRLCWAQCRMVPLGDTERILPTPEI